MKIDRKALEDFHVRGTLTPGAWGDARETACLMSALTGATDIDGCVSAGWPTWLAELGTVIFDNAGKEYAERAFAFCDAAIAAKKRGADLSKDGPVWRAIRLNAILPIALEAVGDGDEQWRTDCRAVVQWSIDRCGRCANPAQAAGAVEAAWTAGGAWAARASGAVWAASATEAAGASRYADAAAHTRIFETTIAALKGGNLMLTTMNHTMELSPRNPNDPNACFDDAPCSFHVDADGYATLEWMQIGGARLDRATTADIVTAKEVEAMEQRAFTDLCEQLRTYWPTNEIPDAFRRMLIPEGLA